MEVLTRRFCGALAASFALLMFSGALTGCPALRPPLEPSSPEQVRLELERVTDQGLYLRIIPGSGAPPSALRLECARADAPAAPLYDLSLSETQREAWSRGALELRDPDAVAGEPLRYTLALATDEGSPLERVTRLQTSSRALPPPPTNLRAEAGDEGVTLRWEPSPGMLVRLMRRPLGTTADEAPAPWEPLAQLEPQTEGHFLDRSARAGRAYAYSAQHIDPAPPAPHLGAFGSPVYVALPPAP